MNEIPNPNQPSNSHELITDCNTDKMKTHEVFENLIKLLKSELSEDSYAFLISRGAKLEEHCQQQACDFVNWAFDSGWKLGQDRVWTKYGVTRGYFTAELYQQFLKK